MAELEQHRRTGQQHIVLDNPVMTAFRGNPAVAKLAVSDDRYIRGEFSICIDDEGDVSETLVRRSTGNDGYDTQIMREMKSWSFEPFTRDGHAFPVCSVEVMSYGHLLPTIQPGDDAQ